MLTEAPPIPDDNRVLYFERDRQTFRFLSHFHPAPIDIDGETWPTVEHFYQAQKSPDPAYRQAIREAVSPGQAKRLAAQPMAPRRISAQSWFRRNDVLPRQDWHDVKLEIMRRADRAKYAQHPDLAARLCATGTAELIEDSPAEPFWGIGPNGQGHNWAGRVLMEIRQMLQSGGLGSGAVAKPHSHSETAAGDDRARLIGGPTGPYYEQGRDAFGDTEWIIFKDPATGTSE